MRNLIALSLLLLLCSCNDSNDNFMQKDSSKTEIKLWVKNQRETPLEEKNKAADALIARRFIIEVYPTDGEQPIERKEIIYNEPRIDDYTRLPIFLELTPNKYKIALWCDYIDKNTGTDLYYKTPSLNAIELHIPYENSAVREALFAYAEIEIGKEDKEHELRLDLKHSTASFQLLATDWQDFIQTHGEIDSLYYATISYDFFYPMGFDATKGEPNQAKTGVKFTNTFRLNQAQKEACKIVADHVFSHSEESSIRLNLSITTAKGEIINQRNSVKIPCKRGYVSLVKANFLTNKSEPNVDIDVEFEEDINIDLDS